MCQANCVMGLRNGIRASHSCNLYCRNAHLMPLISSTSQKIWKRTPLTDMGPTHSSCTGMMFDCGAGFLCYVV